MSRDDDGVLELNQPLDPPPPISTRAAPPRPRRLSRRVILLFAGGSAIGLAVALMFALGSAHHSAVPKETAMIEHRQVPGLLATAPRDYAAAAERKAVALGPPAAALSPDPDASDFGAAPAGSADPAPGGERAAELQRQRQQRESARASKLFATSNEHGRPAGSDGASPGLSASPPSQLDVASIATPPPNADAQDRKAAFVASGDRAASANSGRLLRPSGRHVVVAGSTIAAALITGLSSDLPGEVVAQVTEDVFDSPTGRTRLIPQGTRLIGSYDAHVSYGQSRALVVWTRLILPDGRSLDLDRLIGTDAAGQSGFADRVNQHTGKLLGAGLLSTLFGVGVKVATSGGDNNDIAFAIRDSAGQSVGRAGDKLVERQLDVQPTITVRPGARVRVLVSRDLVMEPWPAAGG